jgi:hypothetical protein
MRRETDINIVRDYELYGYECNSRYDSKFDDD